MAEEGSDNSSEEKKHDATPRKQQQAREKGQVARAPDFIKLVLMTAFFLIALLPGSLLMRWMLRSVPAALGHAGTMPIAVALRLALTSFATLSVLLLILTLLGAFGGLVPGGWSASAKPITPDPSKLNPAKGIKNMFSPKRLTETLKSILKFFIVGGAGLMAFMYWKKPVAALPRGAAPDWTLGLHAIVWILGVCILASIFIVALDTPLQAWFHRRDLRMTDKELRDEQKETDVNPHVRRRLRQAQARVARGRMMEQLPQASAVAVNPAHYAVAFRYRRHQDSAPVIIASGAGKLAARIRKIARRHGIPIVAAPPLARALYFHGTVGEPIPTALYQACAEVLAYVWRLQLWASGQGSAPMPPTDSDLAVDERLDPETLRARSSESG
jgi:flagellar biosynthetic protein FlhB